MSLTLGEKLRQAREERGFTISEVAEQTRISSLYLESIENDDYRTLPGGIFNKGFVKSYSKFVGVNEQEALADYSRILADASINEETELKLYKPEVLTDDRTGGSIIPTVITAVVILGIMTAGILFLLNYLRQPAAEPGPVSNVKAPAVNANGVPPVDNASETSADTPDMATLKVEIKALNQPVRLVATKDGIKSDNVLAAGSSSMFDPKESLILNYNRWNAASVQMTINGKPIALPSEPLKGSVDRSRIEFTISKDNISQIWSTGSISTEVPAASSDANTTQPVNTGQASTQPTAPVKTPAPKANVAANTASTPKPESKPTEAAKPSAASTPNPTKTTKP